ncbi:MAG: DUF6036 family nucleotidyltransferase [bacterium]
MSSTDVFRRIIAALDAAGIPYMLTGSFASSLHGLTRATQDIDFVIAPTENQLRELVRQLPSEDYYVDLEAALDALRRRSQFNVIDLDTGWKVDLIVRRERPFSVQEFERRQEIDFSGLRLAVATAEDVILAKLEWATLGSSQRQIEDVAGILQLRHQEIDLEYVEDWVTRLELGEAWKLARRSAGIE